MESAQRTVGSSGLDLELLVAVISCLSYDIDQSSDAAAVLGGLQGGRVDCYCL